MKILKLVTSQRVALKDKVELLCLETLSQLKIAIFQRSRGYNVILQHTEFSGKPINIHIYKSTDLATIESFQRWLASEDSTVWTIDKFEYSTPELLKKRNFDEWS